MMNEAVFRKRVQESFDAIEKALSEVDPDLAECDQSLGSLTITFVDRSRCILSTQPSVRQLWLALASKGVAHHFNYDEASGRWVDDKGNGIELMAFLKSVLHELTGLDLRLG